MVHHPTIQLSKEVPFRGKQPAGAAAAAAAAAATAAAAALNQALACVRYNTREVASASTTHQTKVELIPDWEIFHLACSKYQRSHFNSDYLPLTSK